jgi:adenylate kinase family enzyme
MMQEPARRILIFGNSGSGKSTLARQCAADYSLAHLDLDTLAWEPTTPPTRRPLDAAGEDIGAFMAAQSAWVIEGCYTDLLEMAALRATHAIWMDLSIEDCVRNAKLRPWEPHKYPSKAAQDANLPMLVEWITQYEERDDDFSRAAHGRLYDRFCASKSRRTRLYGRSAPL